MIKVIVGENKLLMNLTFEQRKVIEEQLVVDNPAYSSAMKFSRNKQYVTVPQYLCYFEEQGRNKLLVPAGYKIPFKHKVVRDDRVKVRVEYPKRRLKLREDQRKALLSYLFKPQKGVLCLPTGAGKTILGLSIASALHQRTLIVTNRDDLLNTWIADAQKLFGIKKESIGVIKGAKYKVGKLFTVATVQTLSRRDLSNLASSFGLVIVDETHHVPAATFSSVLSQFQAFYKIGLTATLEREDGLTKVVHWFLGDIAFSKDESDDIMPVEIRRIKTDFKVKKVPKRVNRFGRWVTEYVDPARENMLKQLFNNKDRNELILDYVIGSNLQGNNCVVFTHRVKHAELLYKEIKRRRIPVALLTGQSPNRKELYKKCEEGKIRCAVATYQLVKEGINIKSWNRGFSVTPTANKTECIQAVGRIRRTKKGKVDSIWYDFVDDEVPKYKSFAKKRLKYWNALSKRIVTLDG